MDTCTCTVARFCNLYTITMCLTTYNAFNVVYTAFNVAICSVCKKILRLLSFHFGQENKIRQILAKLNIYHNLPVCANQPTSQLDT